jgi:hypothetical protein
MADCWNQKKQRSPLVEADHFLYWVGSWTASKSTQSFLTASRLRDADFFCPASTVAFLKAGFFFRWARNSRSSVFDRAVKYSIPSLASAAQALSQPDMNGTPAIHAL